MPREVTVNLSKSAKDRWNLSDEQIVHARQLANIYYQDLGGSAELVEMAELAVRPILQDEYWQEIESLADITSVPVGKILLCNGYYDLIKPLIGCTSFAFDTERGPIHARNLDWWSDNDLLSSSSILVNYVGGSLGNFSSVAWPGYNGVLSGFAPGRFAITLNAVLSDDPFEISIPISYEIRKAFETFSTFEEVVSHFQTTTLATDCLLLISGTQQNEMVVIERTPKRSATREAKDGRISVANEYIALATSKSEDQSELQATSNGRYNRINSLLKATPKDFETCLAFLSDTQVKMNMTVQQMVFQASSGDYVWRKA